MPNFSGGQQQRLSIARTLLGQPEILILDDSTSAVDLATEARLRAALTTRMHGRSMIIIAQRVSAIKHADNILVLDHGRISAMGSHAELIKSSPIYRSIVASQFGEEALANATG
jgi:ATP-binding cassette subfamily B multidrug efflux pump